MTADYTPTTDEVREAWVDHVHIASRHPLPCTEFDRWLASVKADAFDEALVAADSFIGNGGDTPNPYRKDQS